ncbi:MAG TPA: hypothetical protein VF883_00770 [Thermoanaerobaculia bacterium]|jgi:RNA polymerase sigma factor (sigma-70 family)
MHPRELLEQSVEVVDRVVLRVCRRSGMAAGEVDDFASAVKLALVENDYTILRRFEGRSSLATYLTIVIQRLLADHFTRLHGRWRPSQQAERLGPRAVLVEDLVGRQRRSIEDAAQLASMTTREVADIAERLPVRAPRAREVPLPPEQVVPLASRERTDGELHDRELRGVSARAGSLLRDAIGAWNATDRMLLRLRFESSLSIADIARLMNIPQRPLYRQFEALFERLRNTLAAAGIDPAAAADLLAAADRIELDFGAAWKNADPRRTNESETEQGSEEERP